MRSTLPCSADTRIRRFFAWLPVTTKMVGPGDSKEEFGQCKVFSERRWLEFVTVRERFYWGTWHPEAFIDDHAAAKAVIPDTQA
jgi:hypothetical protein